MNTIKKLTLLLAMVGFFANTFSQSTMLWTKNIKAQLPNYQMCWPSIKACPDTIVVTSRIQTNNGQKLMVVKYNILGDSISSKTFGGDSVQNNTIIDFEIDSNKNIYILNQEKTGFYKSKIVIQKYDENGGLVWISQIQNQYDTSYTPLSIAFANDSSFFIAVKKEYDYPNSKKDVVYTKSNSQLYSFDSQGNKIWYREFYGISECMIYVTDIIVYENTAYFIGLDSMYTYNLIKVNINNTISVKNNLGISNGAKKIFLSHDHKLLITALTSFRVSKLDLNGNLIWTNEYPTYMPPNYTGDIINDLILDPTGNIYATGIHYGFNIGTPYSTYADILTLKYNLNGNIIWENRYQGDMKISELGYIIKMKDGQIYVGGNISDMNQNSEQDYLVIKIDSVSGILSGTYTDDSYNSYLEVVTSLDILSNGKLALTGYRQTNQYYDCTTQLLSNVVLRLPENEIKGETFIFPNPISSFDKLNIVGKNLKSYQLVNNCGQILIEGFFKSDNNNQIKFDKIPPGIYTIVITSNNRLITKELIIY